ncbi:PQQ-binding-like beta-propeller repeat protein [Amycolatopsis taiwanensis]|uniref:Pyrrolo-quinoline quinone repeat domain-containing protein n=1 Tax=Amycolatopsis taiwanensis TaxID=342230 RepID=A0A9W6VJ52_9PSEU|nr:PQQ-binding-like beta-propeller repeat protein [Amycolatopsis taiwanensis]GLY69112.1 hypothetical protein Atai01_57310 [Amycolatopsis taiwanensis]
MRRHALARLGIAAVAGVLLAACGTETAEPLPEPEVVRVASEPQPAPDVPDAELPAARGPMWTAPFDDVPRAAGDMLVGLVYPTDEQADLSVVGVDASGSTRWAVRTNPACVGYGVTNSGGRAVAVVLASDADNRNGRIAAVTTANAYDAHDGDRVWGPVSVPGPMQGPGLIFGMNTPSIVGGAQGEKVMLSAAAGTPVKPPRAGAAPLYEHEGIGLFGGDGIVTAVDTRSGSVLWESSALTLPEDWNVTRPMAALADGADASDSGVVALRWSDADAIDRMALHDLRTGRLIAALGDEPEPRTAVDTGSGTVVVTGLDGFRVARAFDLASGVQLWEDASSGGMLDLMLAHQGVGYGTRGGRSVAIDLRTGQPLGDGDWPVPVVASAGAMVSALPPTPGDVTSKRSAGTGPRFGAYQRG